MTKNKLIALITVVLAVIIALSAAACSGSKTAPDAADPAASQVQSPADPVPDEKPQAQPREEASSAEKEQDAQSSSDTAAKPTAKPAAKPTAKPAARPYGNAKPAASPAPAPAPAPEAARPEAKPDQKPDHKPGGEPKPQPSQEPQVPAAAFASTAKLVDLGWSRFAAIQLAEGVSARDLTFAIDGAAIHPTPVTDDSSILKWEVTAADHKTLTISDGTASQQLTLGTTANKPSAARGDAMADYIMTNGPILVWDYHLTNYNDAGNPRVVPAKTTFGLGAPVSPIQYYSPDAEIIPTNDNVYQATGEAVVMFNYNTAGEKDWIDSITDVDLVSYDENKTNLNTQLAFTLDTAYPHGNHTVAAIRVPIGQENFFSNGRYNLRVTSGGRVFLFPIHLVNQTAPHMEQQDRGLTTQTDRVYFDMKDMVYGATMPVYRAELTRPDGTVRELTKIDDWYLIGDLFVLYNEELEMFPTAGDYTLRLWADGFKPFDTRFHINDISADKTAETWQAANPLSNAALLGLDGISTASVGGGGSSGGSGGGDTKVMNGFIVFDTDLLVNAYILQELGIQNTAAAEILSRWAAMNPISIYNEGSGDVYDFDAYDRAVKAAAAQGGYLTFADYTAREDAVTTLNRPASVKKMLEDGLLGLTTTFSEAVSKPAPDLTLTIDGDNAVFACQDSEWLAAVGAKGEIYLGKNGAPLNKNRFAVTEDTLTIFHVPEGKTELLIRPVPGYQSLRMVFERVKVLQDVQLSAGAAAFGDDVVVTCSGDHGDVPCDFFHYITGVKVTAPNGSFRTVLPEGQETAGLGYTISGNTLTIGGGLFADFSENQTGTFTIDLNAEFYNTRTVTVELTAKPAEPESPAQEAPALKEVKPDFFGDYQLIFGGEGEFFLKALTDVTVNGKEAGHLVSSTTDGILKVYASAFTRGADNIVIVSARGYKDLTVTLVLDAQGTPSIKKEVPQAGKDAPAALPLAKQEAAGSSTWQLAFKGEKKAVSEYLSNVTGITVDGQPLSFQDVLHNAVKAYNFSPDFAHGGDNLFINFTADCFGAEDAAVVITAKGYKDLSFVQPGTKAPDPEPEPEPEPQLPAAPAVRDVTAKSSFFGNYFTMSFQGNDDGKAAESYLKAVTSIKVNGTELTKVSSFYGDTLSYKFSNDPSYGGACQYLDITGDCFQGSSTTIVITADGYAELTYTYTK